MSGKEKEKKEEKVPKKENHPSLDSNAAKRAFDKLGKDKVIDMYSLMCRIRRFEEEAGRQYQMGNIKGFCHLYIGQEAVSVGSISALNPSDYVVAAYRDHGHAITKGLDPKAVMAELFGKADGVVGGFGGSMHLFDAEKGFLGGWGIVGGHIPTAAGVAFGAKYKGGKEVCLCYLGDGSLHQGVVHETLNMSQLWKLPVIFIIENNLYGMGTAVDRVSALTKLDNAAEAYNMAHSEIDGDDVFVVYNCLDEAVQRARQEQLPTLINAVTYRYRGHSMSDPATYRSKEEVQEHMDRDPIIRLGNWLLDNNHASQQQLDEIDKSAKKEAKDATKFAKNSPQPGLDELEQHAYVEPIEPIL